MFVELPIVVLVRKLAAELFGPTIVVPLVPLDLMVTAPVFVVSPIVVFTRNFAVPLLGPTIVVLLVPADFISTSPV